MIHGMLAAVLRIVQEHGGMDIVATLILTVYNMKIQSSTGTTGRIAGINLRPAR